MDYDPATMPDELVIELRRPVTFPEGPNGITYSELKLREPTGFEWRKMNATPVGIEQTLTLIHLVAGIPKGAVEMIGARDLKRAGDYLAGFFGDERASSG